MIILNAFFAGLCLGTALHHLAEEEWAWCVADLAISALNVAVVVVKGGIL